MRHEPDEFDERDSHEPRGTPVAAQGDRRRRGGVVGHQRRPQAGACPPEASSMVLTAVATAEGPEPGDELRRRFPVSSRAVIGRSRAKVWDEYAQVHHPAWSEHRDGKGPEQRVGDVRGVAVGAATLCVPPGVGSTGVLNLTYSVVAGIQAGLLVTTETIVPGCWELTETFRFTDHRSGGTVFDLSSSVNTVPLTESKAMRLQHNLARLQRGYLTRAPHWKPGVEHIPNVIAPEVRDLTYEG